MCGIAAIISSVPGKDYQLNIKRMTDVIRHRGPDDEGFVLFDNEGSDLECYYGKDTPEDAINQGFPYSPFASMDPPQKSSINIALGHRRLSILDLSATGHQPLCTQDRRYWIVYNGEVYNYLELAKELKDLGHSFFSTTDTEVVLHSYCQWGTKCLEKFNGMFAFVIYDSYKREIFIARDRFGIKPLYLWKSPLGFLAIASEIKQFTVLPGWRARLNGQKTYDFLRFGFLDHSCETMFDRVQQLCGGEAIFGPVNEIVKRTIPFKWYEIIKKDFHKTFNEAVSEFNDLLTDSIELRLRSDVEVGSCLSGGLDSSSIVCVVSKILHNKNKNTLQKTFSACSHHKKYDEREYIDQVIKKANVKAYFVYPERDKLVEDINTLTWQQDEPFGSTSIFAQYNVFNLAAGNNIKVMLDGQGADETLIGYYSFINSQLTSIAVKHHYGKLIKEIKAYKSIHGYNPLALLLRTFNRLVFPSSVTKEKNAFEKNGFEEGWINVDKINIENLIPRAYVLKNSMSLYDVSYSELTKTNLPMLLHWEDRNSMAHSIESRVPFLDFRLVEFVMSLPDNFKVDSGITKRVLRDCMKSILPSGICNRTDKMGFTTPEEIWIKNEGTDYFREKINETIDMCNGILNREIINRKVENIIHSREPFSSFPWRIISFGNWMSVFNVGI